MSTLTLFVINSLIFGLTIGVILALAFTSELEGFKRVIATIILSILIGSAIGGFLTIDYTSDKKLWNDGYCECGGKWEIVNVAVRTRGSKIYVWKCNKCDKIIELDTKFE